VTKKRQSSGVWLIEGQDGTTTFFRRRLPGNLSESEIKAIVQRLACRHLTADEVVSASRRKGYRTTHLETGRDSPPTAKRASIFIIGAVDYIASHWREDELVDKPDISDGLKVPK
jgi:hypothetical protein